MEAPVLARRDVDDSLCLARSLVEAARQLSAELTIDGVCGAALRAAERLFGVRSAWVMLYERSSSALRTVASVGPFGDVYRRTRVPFGEGIAGLVLLRREPMFVPDVRSEHRWVDVPRMHASALQSLLILPLTVDKDPMGVLALDRPSFESLLKPTPADLEWPGALAALAAVALRNARRYEASRRARRRLRASLRQHSLTSRTTHLQREVCEASSRGRLIGNSPALRAAVEQAVLVARGDTTVLVLGETGTGKDLLARLIHERSRRSRGPFIAVNCAAMPGTLVESELFGHEKGAFTGALAGRAGSFEAAHGGTLLLDEIGDLALEAQAKLLRVLQERQVRRVGATRTQPVDVRVIAATNRDLERSVVDGGFRADLYYRLSAFPLYIPALRERRGDITQLARHFIRHFAGRLRKPVTEITDTAVERLEGYPWPGNIRELQNVIERAVILCQSAVVDEDLVWLTDGAAVGRASGPRPPPAAPATAGPTRTFADAERRAIVAALDATGWRVSGAAGAAARLGLKPTTLHGKMKRLGIKRPAAQPSPAPLS